MVGSKKKREKILERMLEWCTRRARILISWRNPLQWPTPIKIHVAL